MITVYCENWAVFRRHVAASKSPYSYYWRGQKNPDWPLASAFEREILKWHGGWEKKASHYFPYDYRYGRGENYIFKRKYYRKIRDRYLKDFKVACSGLRGPSPAELDIEQWWALGRRRSSYQGEGQN